VRENKLAYAFSLPIPGRSAGEGFGGAAPPSPKQSLLRARRSTNQNLIFDAP